MIDVALLSVIRRWRLRDGLAIREIARRTGLSRTTIRKYLNSEIVEPKYAARKSASKLDSFEEKLTKWLETEPRKNRKQRRNLRQMFGDLVALGYRGSYDRVAAFARKWRRQQREAALIAGGGTFIPLVFAPGEAFQFDWSEDWAVIGGERMKFKIARFTAMASHYLFEPTFCNPAAGWEKGQVEKNVQDARRRVWQDAPAFTGLTTLNDWLEQRCLALWHEIKHPEQKDRTIAEVWADEQPHLMPLPPPFDGFVEHTKRVSPTCLLAFERDRYSVPSPFANRPVSLRVYAERLVVVAEGEVIAEHARLMVQSHDRPGRTVYDWRHYLAIVQRKPGALRNGAPFAELPEAFKRLQAIMLKRPGGDREMAEILALVLHHDEHAVLCAVELALDADGVSKQHVLNVLARLLEPVLPAPVDTPEHLVLEAEPVANVSRYDRLREVDHAS